MYTNPLLEEKWKSQKELAEEAAYDIKKMIENAQELRREVEKRLSIKFKEASP